MDHDWLLVVLAPMQMPQSEREMTPKWPTESARGGHLEGHLRFNFKPCGRWRLWALGGCPWASVGVLTGFLPKPKQSMPAIACIWRDVLSSPAILAELSTGKQPVHQMVPTHTHTHTHPHPHTAHNLYHPRPLHNLCPLPTANCLLPTVHTTLQHLPLTRI